MNVENILARDHDHQQLGTDDEEEEVLVQVKKVLYLKYCHLQVTK